jgi:hypothetical protein
VFHAARATDEVSLHITLGVMGRTWADVMIEAMSEACLASPAFRAHLPAGFAKSGFDMRGAERTFQVLIQTFAANAKLAPLLNRFAEGFVSSRRPAYDGLLADLEAAPEISLASRVVARPHLSYLLREEDESLVVLFGPTQITLPAFTREPLEAALSGKPLVVSDLPGPLDDPGKLVLIQRLIREGMVTGVA